MRRLFVLALLAIAANAFGDALQLRVNNGLVVRIDGATAAYTLDASIADAALRDGAITLFGKSAGATKLVVVTAASTRTIDVTVTPAAAAGVIAAAAAPPRRAVVETRYSSGAAQVTNTIDVFLPHSTLRVMNVRYLQEQYGSLSEAFPSISWQFRDLTLFDARVDNSPLTLNNATIRGAHFERDGWGVHAGYTAAAFYDGVILPADRETVAGVSYSRQIAPAWRLMPSIYAYPSRQMDRSRRGAVASLLVAYSPNDRFHLLSELGVSRGAGAAVQLSSITERNRVRADLRWQPRDFAIAGPNTTRGSYADVAWSTRAGRLTSDATFSWNNYLLPRFEQRSVTSSVDLRYRLAEPLALIGGARYSEFEGCVPATARVSNLVVPAGIAVDFAHAGGSAIVRFGQHSNDGTMRGYRLTGRASAGAFSATAYVDRQDDTPTLQLIFQQRPDLALALERLGFEATSPDDIARLLRDNASLLNLGIIEGASVNLTPHRSQAGLELAWSDSSPARQRLRLRIFSNRMESVASSTTSTLAMLSYSRRLAAATDIETSIARFSTPARTSVEVAVRHTFDDLPRAGGGAISGTVVVDDGTSGIADVDIQLDAARFAKTDARGRYAFSGVGSGVHQVTARLPRPDAYFTSASRVDAVAGDVVNFGLALAAARIAGRVLSDAGLGIAGIRVVVNAGGHRLTATTDSDGNFSVMGPKGEWAAEIEPESLPAGYEPEGKLRVRAVRSISGQVAGGGGAEIELRPIGRRIVADAQGRFALRSLPAGELTLVARIGGRVATKTLTVPPQPATISGVELMLRPQSEQVSARRTVSEPFTTSK
jgi:hypothetical protein